MLSVGSFLRVMLKVEGKRMESVREKEKKRKRGRGEGVWVYEQEKDRQTE